MSPDHHHRSWSGGSRVPEPYLLGSAVFRVKEPIRWNPHSHDDHELLWPLNGVIAVKACHQALPAGLPEFDPEDTGCVVVADAARELLLHMNRQDLPRDTRLQRMVAMLLQNPADLRSVQDWAALLHLSTKTVNRILLDEIGMTFTQWRRMMRIDHASSLLANGETVTSWKAGYTSTSAFIAAFRRVMGTTPGGTDGGHVQTSSPNLRGVRQEVRI